MLASACTHAPTSRTPPGPFLWGRDRITRAPGPARGGHCLQVRRGHRNPDVGALGPAVLQASPGPSGAGAGAGPSAAGRVAVPRPCVPLVWSEASAKLKPLSFCRDRQRADSSSVAGVSPPTRASRGPVGHVTRRVYVREGGRLCAHLCADRCDPVTAGRVEVWAGRWRSWIHAAAGVWAQALGGQRGQVPELRAAEPGAGAQAVPLPDRKPPQHERR